MPAEYYNITFAEMSEFLEPQGFRQIELPNTREAVFAKRVDAAGLQLSLRVFTGIVAEASRNVGKDAIRCQLFWRKPNKEIVALQGDKRVHRVKGWKANLQSRLDNWQEMLPKHRCPRCESPLIIKIRKKDQHKFLGCGSYPDCKYTRDLQAELPFADKK